MAAVVGGAAEGAERRRGPRGQLLAGVLPLLARIGWALFSLGFFAGVWEIAWAVGWANPRLLPPPHVFLGNILDQGRYFSPTLRWQGFGTAAAPPPLLNVLFTMAATTARVLAGLALATILSISVGVACRWFVAIERLTLPTITFLAPVSPIAWLPIAIFLFGIGNPPAIFMVFIALFFTVTLATISEIDRVNPNYINVARTMGVTKAQLYARVVLPAIAPGLLVVLRMNMFAAWMVVLLAEATGVGSGLGQIIMLARNTFNPSLVYFTITLIGILGFLSDWALRQGSAAISLLGSRAQRERAVDGDRPGPYPARDGVICRGVGKTWSLGTARRGMKRCATSISTFSPANSWSCWSIPRCGKSTLLYLIAGLKKSPSKGEILMSFDRSDCRSFAGAQLDLPGDIALSLVVGLAERLLRPRYSRGFDGQEARAGARGAAAGRARRGDGQAAGRALGGHAATRRGGQGLDHAAEGAADGRALRRAQRPDKGQDAGFSSQRLAR